MWIVDACIEAIDIPRVAFNNARFVPDIVLTTLNARDIHAAFGLRYLRANLPDALRDRSAILEFEAIQRTVDILERILQRAWPLG